MYFETCFELELLHFWRLSSMAVFTNHCTMVHMAVRCVKENY